MTVANSQFFQNALKVFAPKVPGAVIYSDDLNEATDEIEAIEAVLGVSTRVRNITTFDPTATSWATVTARLNNMDAGVRSTDGSIHPQYALKSATVLQPSDSTSVALTVRGGSGGLADVLDVVAPDNTSLFSVTPLAVTTGRDTTINGTLTVNGGNIPQFIINTPSAYSGDVIRVVKSGTVVFSVKADGSLSSTSSTTSGSVSISDFTNSQHDHSSVTKGGRVIPAGVLMPFAGLTGSLPPGWLPCDGRAISRVTYSDLFNAIGSSYGGGDGVNTFNIPDMRSRLPLGSGSTLQGAYPNSATLGGAGGAAQVSLTSNQLPTHTHDVTHAHTGVTGSESGHNHWIAGANKDAIQVLAPFDHVAAGQATTGRGSVYTGDGNTVGSTGHTHPLNVNQYVGQSQVNTTSGASVGVMNPYLVVNYIIKT